MKITNKITNGITNNQQTNNKQITTNNNDKNIRNNIYLLLLNKYKQNLPKNFNEKIHRISEIKKTKEYESLSFEDQDKLFYELTSYRGG